MGEKSGDIHRTNLFCEQQVGPNEWMTTKIGVFGVGKRCLDSQQLNEAMIPAFEVYELKLWRFEDLFIQLFLLTAWQFVYTVD